VVHRIEKFVLVSTDKAVNPTNVMGATKRVAELICQYFNDAGRNTKFVTVRFGNVLGSRGSVVETFQRQLEQGGPLTVTDPNVMRYFMTIPEASQLILQAMVLGEGGEVFVLDMGEPVKIRYMAEQMIRLAGKKIEDIQIQYVGLRPGEKLFEELFHSREKLAETAHKKILKARHRSLDHELFHAHLEILQNGIDTCDEKKIQETIRKMVPELTVSKMEPA
jgi:FlaA1/EpsC-like NDP-sugar epimerase